jgi:hypothetical protein
MDINILHLAANLAELRREVHGHRFKLTAPSWSELFRQGYFAGDRWLDIQNAHLFLDGLSETALWKRVHEYFDHLCQTSPPGDLPLPRDPPWMNGFESRIADFLRGMK